MLIATLDKGCSKLALTWRRIVSCFLMSVLGCPSYLVSASSKIDLWFVTLAILGSLDETLEHTDR
jgi:hypothetical protein